MFSKVIDCIRSIYGQEGFIPLHEPRFVGNEKLYLNDCVDSTFVSSVGKYVTEFEELVCKYTNSNFAVATMNGTAALHMALILSDVSRDDEVLTQALTFVATANAISYCGATPVFIDSASNNLGMCPEDLALFLQENAEMRSDGFAHNKKTGRRLKACVPMHVFGHPVKIDKIIEICNEYNISIIEDAAESLGSFSKGRHTGTIAPIGILSFNGNKVVTCGGGGMLLIQDEELATKAKHLTTTAKKPHAWEFFHDSIGYNYRLPNVNAAMACAQMERLSDFIDNKRETAMKYKNFFKSLDMKFVDEPDNTKSNFWLNALILEDKQQRDKFLATLNDAGVMCRPIWRLMNELPAFSKCQTTSLKNAKYYEERTVNIPSSVVL